MALSVTVNTDATSLRTVTTSGSVNYDVLVPMDPAWSVVTYDPDATGIYARVLNHPSGGSGSFTTEATIYTGNPTTGGGPLCTGRLSASKCGWVRWRNATGWGLTLFNVSSTGIGTVGSEVTIVPSESFAGGSEGGLYRLTDSTALFVYQSGSGAIRAAHIDHSPGLTISGTADYTALVAAGSIQCVGMIDSTHVLLVYWESGALKAAVVADSAGTITLGTPTTLLASGTQFASLHQPSLDGGGCHPITAGSSYLVAVAVGSTSPTLYLWVVNVSSGSITSATADPSNSTYFYSSGSSGFTFTLIGATYLGIASASTGNVESSSSSSITHCFKLDGSHQIASDLGSLSSMTPTRGWFRSIDADGRLVSFTGTYTDTGTAGGTDAGVRGQEFTLNGLITGGWTVGAIAIG